MLAPVPPLVPGSQMGCGALRAGLSQAPGDTGVVHGFCLVPWPAWPLPLALFLLPRRGPDVGLKCPSLPSSLE